MVDQVKRLLVLFLLFAWGAQAQPVVGPCMNGGPCTATTMTGKSLTLTGPGTALSVTNNVSIGGTSALNGATTIGTNTGAAVQLNLNAAAGNARSLRWQSAGSNRWIMNPATAEAASVTTTANGAVAAGQTAVVVASATGIVAGMQISVTGVTTTAYVVSVSGTTVNFFPAATGGGIANGATINFYPNTGANMQMFSANDAGTNFDEVFQITRSTGRWQYFVPVQINGTFGPVSTNTIIPAFQLSTSWAGSFSANPSSNPHFAEILINSDTLDVHGAGNGAQAFRVTYNYGGTNTDGTVFSGSRDGINVQMKQTGAAQGGFFNAIVGLSNITQSMGGSAGFGNAKGNVFAFSGYAEATNALNLQQVSGQENDILIDANSSASESYGITIAHLATHATPATFDDAAFVATDQNGTVGWTGSIFQVGSYQGVFPCNTSGCNLFAVRPTDATIVGAGTYRPPVATNGLYLPNTQFTANSVYVPGMTVSGAGVMNVSALTVTPSTNGISIDADQILTGAAVSTAGTGYAATNVLWDIYGDQFNPTVGGGGAITGFTVLARGHTASPPGAPVALLGGDNTGATATLTFAQKPIRIGGVSNVIIGTGSALATNATAGFLQLATMAGAPTGTVGAAGQAAVVIDTTNKKICYSTGGGTWECSAAFTP